MDSASKNAEDMLDSLYLEYNRARQGAITQKLPRLSPLIKVVLCQKEKVVIGTIAVLVISLAVTFLVLYRKMYVKYYTDKIYYEESPLISVATDENLSGKKGLLLIAHRGLSAIAPENTLPALQQACNYKYYGVEFDVYTTKDEVFILNHDETVDRMTGVSAVYGI